MQKGLSPNRLSGYLNSLWRLVRRTLFLRPEEVGQVEIEELNDPDVILALRKAAHIKMAENGEKIRYLKTVHHNAHAEAQMLENRYLKLTKVPARFDIQVTDHAVKRYVERIMKFDDVTLNKLVVPDVLWDQMAERNFKNGDYFTKTHGVRLQDNFIVTVLFTQGYTQEGDKTT